VKDPSAAEIQSIHLELSYLYLGKGITQQQLDTLHDRDCGRLEQTNARELQVFLQDRRAAKWHYVKSNKDKQAYNALKSKLDRQYWWLLHFPSWEKQQQSICENSAMRFKSRRQIGNT
jgi:L-rhamnose mutarotase